MSLFYRTLLRPAVFLQDSERAHSRVLAVLSKMSRTRFSLSMLGALYRSPDLPVNVFDIDFPNYDWSKNKNNFISTSRYNNFFKNIF